MKLSLMPTWSWCHWCHHFAEDVEDPANDAEDPRDGLEVLVDIEEAHDASFLMKKPLEPWRTGEGKVGHLYDVA